MIVVMEAGATEEQIQRVIERLLEFGFDVHRSTGAEVTLLGAIGVHPDFDPRQIELLDGVRQAVRISRPYRRVARQLEQPATVLPVGDATVGGQEVIVAAGPARVESAALMEEVAAGVAVVGARWLLSSTAVVGASPYASEGVGEQGLQWLREAAERYGLQVVCEVSHPSEVAVVGRYADVLRVAGRNMQHTALLAALGGQDKPVLLERSVAATVEEWLLAAEHVLVGGNARVILCERGVRSFDRSAELALDITVLPLLRRLTHLPVFVDPARATGRRDRVPAAARAAVAAGADGLVLEVHVNPERARAGGARALTPEGFRRLVEELRRVAAAIGRQIR